MKISYFEYNEETGQMIRALDHDRIMRLNPSVDRFPSTIVYDIDRFGRPGRKRYRLAFMGDRYAGYHGFAIQEES